MKRILLLGGPMGVGKSTISKTLNILIPNSEILEGDECWNFTMGFISMDMKKDVLNTIIKRMNNFILNSDRSYLIFNWVMCEQKAIDYILSNLVDGNYKTYAISLMANDETLKKRIQKDIDLGIRKKEDIEFATERNSHFKDLNTIKVFTDDKSIASICNEIIKITNE